MAVRGIKWPGRANLVVSLVAIHKGAWDGIRMLDGQEVSTIGAHFEDSADGGDAAKILANTGKLFQGSIFLGEGFLLTHEQAEELIGAEPANADVIFPVINGQETNNEPDQKPGRAIINFHDWSRRRRQNMKHHSR